MLCHLPRVFITPFFKQYLQKGSKVLVRGEHRHREWERQDGSHACRCEILADEVVFVARINQRGSESSEGVAEAEVGAM